MAINFVTGLPRAGKTLWTLVTVRDRAEREGRQVYTCNIPGITIPGWLEIDHPDLWVTLPHGCIVVIDELQDFWQKGASGSKVPGPILELSKHGKRGIDFYIITQEPNLVHQTPRDLCQHHFYVVRAFGSHNVMVHKFERMQLHPDKQKKLSEKLPWRYKKEAFSWYKSADTHNVKRQIPWKVFMIPGAAAFAGLAIFGAVYFGQSAIDKAKANGSRGALFTPALPGVPGLSPSSSGSASAKPVPMSAAELLASYAPRIEGLPQTAPRYDDVTKPTTAPYPAACVQMGPVCKCYTQQGTKLQTEDHLCRQIVSGGFFMDWGMQSPQGGQVVRNDPVQVSAGQAVGNPTTTPTLASTGQQVAVSGTRDGEVLGSMVRPAGYNRLHPVVSR